MKRAYLKGSRLAVSLSMALIFTNSQADPVAEAWVASYNGPANGKDNAQALAVDPLGNAYVAGFSDGGRGNYDFVTVKYDSDGNQLWVARYDGESQGADWVKALVIDPAGNILVSGSSTGTDTGLDFATVKYDAEGKQLWVSRYDGPAHGDDRVKAMTVDGTGNVYLIGESPDGNGQVGPVTLKYGPDGSLLWAERSKVAGEPDDSLSSIATDPQGNVYVVGAVKLTPGDSDYLTIKYDPSGKVLWTARRDWSENDNARLLGLDADGNSYVAGTILRYTEGNEEIGHKDIAVVKYAPDGKELLATSYNSGAAMDDVASAMRIDPQGHVYITGTRYGEMTDGSLADQFTIKFDTDGTKLWSAPYQGIGGAVDTAEDLVLDPAGAVYALGYERGGADGKFWLVTVKFAADGSGQWVTRNPGMATASTGAISVDGLGNVWMTGSDSRGQDFLTAKYMQAVIPPEAGGR